MHLAKLGTIERGPKRRQGHSYSLTLMRPCLIAIDMDGTLLGSNGRVSVRNRAALLAAEQRDVEIVIATGRRHAYAMRVLRDLGLRGTNAMISSNGTVTRTIDSTLVQRTHMPLETARWLCREVEEFRDTFVLTFDNVGPDGEDRNGALVCEQTEALHASIGAWMRTNEPYIRRVDRMEQVLGGSARQVLPGSVAIAEADGEVPDDLRLHAPIQAMLCGTIERMQAAEARLMRHPAVAGVGQPESSGCEIVLHRTVYPAKDLAILDILPAGCSKASALARLAALRGCTLQDVVAIGDNWNDVPMLRAAGRAVLMSNAPVELLELARQQGWTIGASNDEDGVAQAIEAAIY
ncbi:MAG: HAD-IIB family hydrolase [Janthinobacterium lividum]